MIRRALYFLADGIYAVVILGLISGSVISAVRFLDSQIVLSAPFPAETKFPLLVFSLIVTLALLEYFLPIRSVTPKSVLYRPRSLKTRLGFEFSGLLQIIVVSIIPFAFLELKESVVLASTVALLRIGIGFNSWRLPRLLISGKRTGAVAGAWFVQDSELISKAIAQTQLRLVAFPQGGGRGWLAVRRIFRRAYLIPVFATTVLWGATVSFVTPVGAILMLFVVQSVSIAGILRCCSFEEYEKESILLSISVIAPFVLVSSLAFLLLTQGNILGALAYVVALVKTGFSRAKSRRADGDDFVETGFGAFSIGVFDYYSKGLPLGFALVIASLLLGQLV